MKDLYDMFKQIEDTFYHGSGKPKNRHSDDDVHFTHITRTTSSKNYHNKSREMENERNQNPIHQPESSLYKDNISHQRIKDKKRIKKRKRVIGLKPGRKNPPLPDG